MGVVVVAVAVDVVPTVVVPASVVASVGSARQR